MHEKANWLIDAVLLIEKLRCRRGLNLVPDGLRSSESLVPTNFGQEHSHELAKNEGLTSGFTMTVVIF